MQQPQGHFAGLCLVHRRIGFQQQFLAREQVQPLALQRSISLRDQGCQAQAGKGPTPYPAAHHITEISRIADGTGRLPGDGAQIFHHGHLRRQPRQAAQNRNHRPATDKVRTGGKRHGIILARIKIGSKTKHLTIRDRCRRFTRCKARQIKCQAIGQQFSPSARAPGIAAIQRYGELALLQRQLVEIRHSGALAAREEQYDRMVHLVFCRVLRECYSLTPP